METGNTIDIILRVYGEGDAIEGLCTVMADEAVHVESAAAGSEQLVRYCLAAFGTLLESILKFIIA